MWTGGAFALGLVIGSFLNVVIHRLPRGESLVRPASRCPGCQRPIRPWENVPLLSYLALRGRCRGCGVGIPLRYPGVELLTGLLFVTVAWRYGPTPIAALWMLFSAGLVAAAWIDLDHGVIPDSISLGGLAVGLVVMPGLAAWRGEPPAGAGIQALAGALLGGGLLWLVGFVHARISVAFGRRFDHWPGEGQDPPRPGSADYWLWFPGMGLGDVKLLAAIGAFVGPVGVLETIVAASLLGLVLGLLAARSGGPFGFGPAIAAGALLVVLVPHRPLLVGLGP
jgi:leader peptidase (prepilin peptidase)/N-methyltransferase